VIRTRQRSRGFGLAGKIVRANSETRHHGVAKSHQAEGAVFVRSGSLILASVVVIGAQPACVCYDGRSSCATSARIFSRAPGRSIRSRAKTSAVRSSER
jgi:hypothetical protein